MNTVCLHKLHLVANSFEQKWKVGAVCFVRYLSEELVKPASMHWTLIWWYPPTKHIALAARFSRFVNDIKKVLLQPFEWIAS